eukprot:TRINITY_DN10457_c0_g1_i1.p3 TRINITY_DN10457_c0_g1~~TRINITY_DN10457_c0_g1_i1.p3  ORF type:complete len:107 (+),score=10.68 TRINITY_DN10457_c0_g1_i1:1273-1593(+)
MGQWHKRSSPVTAETSPELDQQLAVKAHGLARDLVKLVANLVAKCKANQDLLRLKEVRTDAMSVVVCLYNLCLLASSPSTSCMHATGHSSRIVEVSSRRSQPLHQR